MKRMVRLVALGAACLGLCVACSADSGSEASAASSTAAAREGASDVDPRCSNETLEGRYLYEIHGNKRFAEGLFPYLEVGAEVYDGHGGITNTHTDSVTREDTTTTATYEIDATCRGRITYESGVVQQIFVSPAGDELTFFEAPSDAPQGNLDGGATRVDDGDGDCSTSTLTGTYSYRARGFLEGAVHIEHGFETYAGDGAVTNAFSVNGEQGTQYLTGTYEVGEDCRARVTYEGGDTFSQYLSPDGEEFIWIQVDGFEEGDDAGLFGGHEHRVTTSTDPALTADPGA